MQKKSKSKMYSKMRQFGLIGFPLNHSFSPSYFSAKFEREGLTNCRYDAFPLPSIGQLPKLLEAVPALEGLNVTIPYKSLVIPYLHDLSKAAAAIGAVNVIKLKNGHLTGYNSDVDGFKASLDNFLPNPLPTDLKALVLGTGGASKAVAFVLQKKRVPYLLVSRHSSPNNLVYEAITPHIFDTHHLIINTTPLGMTPYINDCPPISYELATPNHYFYDLIYNPEKTLFLTLGESKGAHCQNGLSMLYLQAERAWEIWNA